MKFFFFLVYLNKKKNMSKINTVEDILLSLPRNLVTLITSFLHIKKKKPIKTLEDILSNLSSDLINYILTFVYKKKNIGEIKFKRQFFRLGKGIGRRPFLGENEIKILCQNENIIKGCKFPYLMLGIIVNNNKYQFYILKKIQILNHRIGDKNILKLAEHEHRQYRLVLGYEIIDAGNDFFEALYRILRSSEEGKSLYDNIFFQNY